ncbi:hypothetical protein FOPE_10973 [Fonsecaea pedrosoi]|nr:hypothetical protein FOPE_10973 [Fonsecaea pedrosoi]
MPGSVKNLAMDNDLSGRAKIFRSLLPEHGSRSGQNIRPSTDDQVRINVSGLKKPGCADLTSEEILIGKSEEVYQLIEILKRRGYTDICGFQGVSSRSPSVGPITGLDCDLPVEVVTGEPCYSLSKGLKINADQTLIDFYDQFVSGPRCAASPISSTVCSDSILIRDARDCDAAKGLEIKFHRTLRAPDDGKIYPLSTDFGQIKMLPVASLSKKLPPDTSATGGALFPLYQREAVVVHFDRTISGWMDPEAPATFAIRAFEGHINCVTGRPESFANNTSVQDSVQDYVVFPLQQRLDGCVSQSGGTNQFVSLPLGSNSRSPSQAPTKILRFQVAPRYPDGCNFIMGDKKSSGLDIHATPNQLRLNVGTSIKMGGSRHCQRRLKETAYRTASLELFKNEDLYPFPKDHCRPTYIWELKSLTAGEDLQQPKGTWSISSVGSLWLSADWLSFGISGKPNTTIHISPFHNLQSFRARVKSRMPQESPAFDHNKLAINGNVLLEDPDICRIVQQGLRFNGPAGILTLTKETIESLPKQVNLYGKSRPSLSRWDVGLIAGGRADMDVHADDNPKAWNWTCSGLVTVHILNHLAFEDITSIACPSTPIELSSYFTHKIPVSTFQEAGVIHSIDKTRVIQAGIVVQSGRQVACLLCEENLCDTLTRIPPATIETPPTLPSKPTVAYEDAMKSALAQTSVLTDVCGKGAENRVFHLLERGAKVNESPAEEGGRTPLQAAAEGGHLKIVEILLAHGADVNGAAAPFNGMSALAAAADRGHVEVVKMLLARGAHVNAVLPGWRDYSSALQYACKAGHTEIIRSLLEAGAEPNNNKWKSASPLCLAAEHGFLEAVQLLLEYGAEVDNAASLELDHGRPRGTTPLHEATTKQHKEVVDLLLRHGADPAIVDAGQSSPLHIAAAFADQAIFHLLLASPRIHKFVEMRDKYKAALMQTICKDGSFDRIKYFLARVPGPRDHFPLKCWAVFFCCGLGYTRTVEGLLGLNLSPNFSVSNDATRLVGYQAETSLEHAILKGHTEVVELLLKRGAIVSSSGGFRLSKENPILTAASKGFLDILKLLLANGVSFDQALQSEAMQKAAKNGHTAVVEFIMSSHQHSADKSEVNKSLHKALAGSDAPTSRLLLVSGADANCEHEGRRPLHLACFSAEIVELLLAHGADVGAEDEKKNLPLHKAAFARNKDAPRIVQLLLEAGSPIDQKNAARDTPLMNACAARNVEVIKELVLAGADARATDAEGRTPLHLCCARDGDHKADQHEAIRVLASLLWVDVDAEDDKGRTPLDLAAQSFRSPVVRTLLDVGADPELVDLERLRHGIVVAHEPRATIYECEAVWQIRKALGQTESLYGDELPVGFKRVRRLDSTDKGGSMKQVSEDGTVDSFVFDMAVLNAISSFRDL